MKQTTRKILIGLFVFVLLGAFSLPQISKSQTREDLIALIQVLIARVAELQAQIAARSSTSTYGYNFTRDLTLGSTGQDVNALQQFLVAKGFMNTPSGYGTFGPATQNALASYQRARRITPVAGFFGPTTRAIVTQESQTIAFNFGGSGGGGTTGTTIAINTPQYGIGGSGNAPIVPRRTGGGGGGGGRSSSSSSNSNNNNNNDNGNSGDPSPGGVSTCNDDNDNDSDGLTDFPIDPGCSSASSSEGSNPDSKSTYAFKHFIENGNGTQSYRRCSSNGQGGYTCNNLGNFDNVIYPWSLVWQDPDSMNVEMAKAYLSRYPDDAKAMFSWTMESGNAFQNNFFRDADNCTDANGQVVTYANPSSKPAPINNAGTYVGSGQQIPYRCPWMDDWLSIVKPRWDNFFRDYKAVGGKVEMVFGGQEGLTNITNLDATKVGLIQSNPKYSVANNNFSNSELARGPMRDKLGSLDSLLRDPTACAAVNCYNYASLFLADWYYSYVNNAITDSLHAHFPNAGLSNYNTMYYDYDTYALPIYNDTNTCQPGIYCSNGAILGNYQNMNLSYGPGLERVNWSLLAQHGVTELTQTPFNKVKQEAIWVKVSRLSNPDSGMSPVYGGTRNFSSSPGTYAESIFHSLLAGSDHLQMWHDNPPMDTEERDLSLAMKEFDKIAGFTDKETMMFEDDYLNDRLKTNDPSAWNDDYVLTGMRTGGRKVWRFTPDFGSSELPTLASSLLNTSPATFQTGQVKITFPEGVIYTPSSPQSARGYWVIQPEDADDPVFVDSDINIPPVANFWITRTVELAGYVLIGSTNAYDPDGTITRSFDFNNDNVFDDPIILFDGTVFEWAWRTPESARAWFNYKFTPGPHTIQMKVTDNDGAVTIIKRSFTIPNTACPTNANDPQCGVNLTVVAQEKSNFHFAQAINSFWQGFASVIFGFFSSLISFFRI